MKNENKAKVVKKPNRFVEWCKKFWAVMGPWITLGIKLLIDVIKEKISQGQFDKKEKKEDK